MPLMISKIKVHVDLDDALVNIGQALPLGFILTELVSNCLKHAFPGGQKGEVKVTFRKDENSGMVLSVSDDGIGFPEHVTVETPETLGLRLVQMFARQINADLEIPHNGGTGSCVLLTLQEGSVGSS